VRRAQRPHYPVPPRRATAYRDGCRIGGDHNPIHTNPIAAKLFGFPTVIAHGMFTAAAVLANVEGQLPDAVKYSVRFASQVVLPASAGLYVGRISDDGPLTLRNLKKGDPRLTGSVTAL
jgi:hypothetical protein